MKGYLVCCCMCHAFTCYTYYLGACRYVASFLRSTGGWNKWQKTWRQGQQRRQEEQLQQLMSMSQGEQQQEAGSAAPTTQQLHHAIQQAAVSTACLNFNNPFLRLLGTFIDACFGTDVQQDGRSSGIARSYVTKVSTEHRSRSGLDPRLDQELTRTAGRSRV